MKMMKILRTLVALSACGMVWTTASAETYVSEVGQFEKLKINGNIRVVYKHLPDSTGMASYEAPPGNADVFKFTTKNDRSLRVEPSDEKWGNLDLPVVTVYSDFLTNVDSYTDLTVDILNLAPVASFTVNQVGNGTITIDNVKSNNLTAGINTGNGSIYISGTCINANFRMVGAGLISADRLKADNVKCRILGTGSIGCWPIDNLNVTGLGTTKIYYKGSPNIKKTGGGKLYGLPNDNDDSNRGVEVPSFDPAYYQNHAPEDAGEEVEFQEQIEDTDPDDDSYQTIVTADD